MKNSNNIDYDKDKILKLEKTMNETKNVRIVQALFSDFQSTFKALNLLKLLIYKT